MSSQILRNQECTVLCWGKKQRTQTKPLLSPFGGVGEGLGYACMAKRRIVVCAASDQEMLLPCGKRAVRKLG